MNLNKSENLNFYFLIIKLIINKYIFIFNLIKVKRVFLNKFNLKEFDDFINVIQIKWKITEEGN